jgi:hypothetical protein
MGLPAKLRDLYTSTTDRHYDGWRDSQFPEHGHDCADCGTWIKDCYTYHCDDRGKPVLCETCKQKVA